jgi:hypothetical protein
LLVEQCETLALGGWKAARTHVTAAGQGAVESPCQKDRNTFRLPMRQSTTIETDRKTVVARIDNSHEGRSGTCPTGSHAGRSETCPTACPT